jgi:hypothetical protein
MPESSSDRFKRYEERFVNSSAIIARTVKQLIGSDINKIVRLSVDCEGELSESEAYLRAMEVEVGEIIMSQRRQFQEKVQTHTRDYSSMVERFELVKRKAEAEALKSMPNSHSKLISANSKLDQSSTLLEESLRTVGQTEQIGDNTLDQLADQRGHLQTAREKVEDTAGVADRAHGLLQMMENRAFRHKVCVWFIILALSAANISIIYYKMADGDKKN